MEAALELALPSVAVARLMGSREGFGSGGSSGGIVVGEVRWHTEGACSSGGRKGESDMITPFFLFFFWKYLTIGCCFECLYCICRNKYPQPIFAF